VKGDRLVNMRLDEVLHPVHRVGVVQILHALTLCHEDITLTVSRLDLRCDDNQKSTVRFVF